MLCCSLLFHSLAFSLFALSLFCYFALVALYLKSKGTNRSHCTLAKEQIPNLLIIDLNCFSLEYKSLFVKEHKKWFNFVALYKKSNLLSSLFTKGASTLHKKLKSKFSTPIINKIQEKNTSGHLSISFLQINNSGQLSISFLEMNSSGQLSISMQEKNNLGQLSKGLGLRSFALLLFALSLFSYFALCSFPLLLFCSCCSLLKEQGTNRSHCTERKNNNLCWKSLHNVSCHFCEHIFSILFLDTPVYGSPKKGASEIITIKVDIFTL